MERISILEDTMCKHMSRRFIAALGVALLLTLVSTTAWAGWTQIGVGEMLGGQRADG